MSVHREVCLQIHRQSEECQINNCLAEGTFKVTVDVLLIRLSQCSAAVRPIKC